MTTKPEASPYHLQKEFESETRKYAWAETLDFSRLRATDNIIVEAPDDINSFSNALWDLCFPKFPPGALWHNTSISTLRNIAATQEIRLHTLKDRMSQGELATFARQHRLDGYLSVAAEDEATSSTSHFHTLFYTSEPPDAQRTGRVIDELADQLYFLSLTASENPKWSFGDVRLRLRVGVVQERADLRQITYAPYDGSTSNPFSVLKDIGERVFNRALIPSGLSRVGAFFLPFYFEDESEIRLLVKKYGDRDPTLVLACNATSYMAVPIGGKHDRVKIEVLEVQNRNNSLNAEVAKISAIFGAKYTALDH